MRFPNFLKSIKCPRKITNFLDISSKFSPAEGYISWNRSFFRLPKFPGATSKFPEKREMETQQKKTISWEHQNLVDRVISDIGISRIQLISAAQFLGSALARWGLLRWFWYGDLRWLGSSGGFSCWHSTRISGTQFCPPKISLGARLRGHCQFINFIFRGTAQTFGLKCDVACQVDAGFVVAGW